MKNLKAIQKFLLLASFIGTFAEQMIIPLYGIFVASWGGGILTCGIGFALFAIIQGLIIIGMGKSKWFANNLGLVVMLGFLISGIGDFSFFFVHGAIGLFICQAIIGISVGLLNPAWEALYTKSSEDGSEHEIWSLWGGGASIATGLAALVGSLIAFLFGFKAMFVLTALVNLVAVYYSWKVYKEEKNEKPIINNHEENIESEFPIF